MANPLARRGGSHELPVAALLVAAALPLLRLFRAGGETGAVLLASVGASLLVAWALRRARVPAVLSGAASGLAFAWFASAVFFRETMLGPLPSLESFRALGEALSEGMRSSRIDIAPVAAKEPFLALLSSAIWATAWIVDDAVTRLRNPLLGIGLTVPMFLVPATLVPSARRWLDVALLLAAAAWVLFVSERVRVAAFAEGLGPGRRGWRTGPAAAVAGTGIVLTLIVAPVLPGYGRPPERLRGSQGPRIAYNPLVSIKPTLTSSPVRQLFRVSAAEPTYYRLVALDRFDGTTWTITPRSAPLRIGERDVAPDFPGAPGRVLDQRFAIAALAGPWLPAAFEPVRVRGVPGLRAEPEGRALIIREDLASGLRYRVTSRVPGPTAGDLDRDFDFSAPALRPLLELPRGLPAEIARIARRVAGGEPTPYRRALALQSYLRTYTYDEDVAAGHTYDTLLEFLTEARRGYCEQFAGAMAVLARTLGIPARVAVGFGYGEQTGPTSYSISTRQAHAWVEIFFPGIGWLAFEPTPRAGVAQVPPYAAPDRPDPTPAPNATQSPTASPTPRALATRPEAPNISTTAVPATGIPAWAVPLAVLAGIALLSASAMAGLRIARRVRLRRARTARDAILLLYGDFLGWCAAVGHARRRAETPREHAERLTTVAAPAADPLARAGLLVERALWAPRDGLDSGAAAAALDEARAAIGSRLSRVARLVGASGFGRRRGG